MKSSDIPSSQQVSGAAPITKHVSMTLASSNAIFESVQRIPMDNMTRAIWKNIPFKGQIEYIEHEFGELTLEEADKLRHRFSIVLLQKLPPSEQWGIIEGTRLMTKTRHPNAALSQLPCFVDILEDLPSNAKVVEIGGGEGNVISGIAEVWANESIEAYNIDIGCVSGTREGVKHMRYDVSNGLPSDLPTDCDVIYSNRTLQYVENINTTLQSIHEHLKVGGVATLHVGWGYSFTDALLLELQKSLVGQGQAIYVIEEAFGDRKDLGVYIYLQKTDKPLILPKIQSSLPPSVTVINDVRIPRSHLYYRRKLESDKKYLL